MVLGFGLEATKLAKTPGTERQVHIIHGPIGIIFHRAGVRGVRRTRRVRGFMG